VSGHIGEYNLAKILACPTCRDRVEAVLRGASPWDATRKNLGNHLRPARRVGSGGGWVG